MPQIKQGSRVRDYSGKEGNVAIIEEKWSLYSPDGTSIVVHVDWDDGSSSRCASMALEVLELRKEEA